MSAVPMVGASGAIAGVLAAYLSLYPSSPITCLNPIFPLWFFFGLFIELPASVVLEITYTEPGLQGDRSTGGTKPATLETGAEIAVPLFLETGTKIKVDTRDGSYLGRVS